MREAIDKLIAEAIENGYEVNFPAPLVKILQTLADGGAGGQPLQSLTPVETQYVLSGEIKFNDQPEAVQPAAAPEEQPAQAEQPAAETQPASEGGASA